MQLVFFKAKRVWVPQKGTRKGFFRFDPRTKKPKEKVSTTGRKTKIPDEGNIASKPKAKRSVVSL